MYYRCTHGVLSDIVIPIKALYCKDSNCIDHNIEIESFYNRIVSAIKIARDAFHWWTLNNRPRHGQIYHSRRTSRAQFKYALRYAKSIEETARADSLASDFFQ